MKPNTEPTAITVTAIETSISLRTLGDHAAAAPHRARARAAPARAGAERYPDLVGRVVGFLAAAVAWSTAPPTGSPASAASRPGRARRARQVGLRRGRARVRPAWRPRTIRPRARPAPCRRRARDSSGRLLGRRRLGCGTLGLARPRGCRTDAGPAAADRTAASAPRATGPAARTAASPDRPACPRRASDPKKTCLSLAEFMTDRHSAPFHMTAAEKGERLDRVLAQHRGPSRARA